MKRITISPLDNVCVLLEDEGNVCCGHKVALKDIKKGEPIIKYGEIIGRATNDIKKGEWVHSHNLETHLNESNEYEYIPSLTLFDAKTGYFKGYKRKSGNAGIRNEIFIIPTVGCVNNVCKQLEIISKEYITGSLDGVYALTHQFGCSQLGEDNENIKKLLCAIALNPNATYVIFVGLGCENNSINGIKEFLTKFQRDNIYYLNCQETEDEIIEGTKILKELCNKASKLKRENIDLKELCIGLKCGGSDGFSGITANPLVGQISDKLITFGGSSILTEVPEMFGAEQGMMNKCKDKIVYNKFIKLINDFKNYYTSQNFPIYENPSPGNKKGGITTLEEKSLGCVKKGGTSNIVDILEYGELVKTAGLNVLNAPGNDLIATTALAASGCQIVLFTTGRGTPFSTFVPTMKIATNNYLNNHKNNWIDFNAYTMDKDGLWDLLIKTINGEYKVKNEQMREIAFYKKGVTL